MNTRDSQAGVTLVEMLTALTIAAMIGVGSFALLESVTRSEAGASGRLDRLAEIDRTFRLIAKDALAARSAGLTDQGLEFRRGARRTIWTANDTGVERRIIFDDGRSLVQFAMDGPATLSSDGTIALLRLTGTDVYRVIPLPPE
jgi:prepilin-type N-terminal cleavage/methylation domain-containing protein